MAFVTLEGISYRIDSSWTPCFQCLLEDIVPLDKDTISSRRPEPVTSTFSSPKTLAPYQVLH